MKHSKTTRIVFIECITIYNDFNPYILIIPYNSKREIKRSDFNVLEFIGSGHFGNVLKGELIRLYHPNTKTTVAIKTVNDTSDENVLAAFIGEIKIMSNINPHLNLVNLIGSCTSEYTECADMFLLLEFCQYGDLKQYLLTNKAKIFLNLNGYLFLMIQIPFFSS